MFYDPKGLNNVLYPSVDIDDDKERRRQRKMAAGGRLNQLNQLMQRFLGVPADETDEPDNVYRLLRAHLGATAPIDILRLTNDQLDAITLCDSGN